MDAIPIGRLDKDSVLTGEPIRLLTDHSPYFMKYTIAAFFTGIGLGTVFNYALSKIFVFRPMGQLLGQTRPRKRM
jgi:hypothetical protein